jgi:hypothetical protein
MASMTPARPRLLYLSHAGEDVYALIRGVAGPDFEEIGRASCRERVS